MINISKSIKKAEQELVKAEVKAMECIENMRFLINRIIKLIDSKI